MLNCVIFFLFQIQRQEDDIRARVSTASDQYRKSLIETQAMRQEYFNFQLPRILRVRDPAYWPKLNLIPLLFNSMSS